MEYYLESIMEFIVLNIGIPLFVFIVFMSIIVSIAVGCMAEQKGRSFFAWMIFTFIFGWITLLILYVAKDVDTNKHEKDVT